MVSLTGALGMPPFRERLGTGCTKDSKDSGIEVRPKSKRNRNRPRARMQTSISRKKPISSTIEPKPNDKEDTKQNVENAIVIGLWLMVLYVTNLTFGLPFKIMWPARINHAAVALSYLLIGFWALCAFYFFIRKRDNARWHKAYPKTYYFAWILQLIGFAVFCLSTYPQIQRWSFLVSTFYFCFFATISNTFL